MKDLEKRALEYATLKHKGVYRKGKNHEPYINHPVRVAELVKKYKGDSKEIEFLVAVAYLHDTLEDTDATFEELVDKFGIQVASLVQELTSNEDIKKEIGKEKYLAIKLKNLSSWALLIKLCDRLDNISDLDKMNEKFRNRYIHETKYIIFYLLNDREVSKTHLDVIKDITNTLRRYSLKDLEKEKVKSYLPKK